MNIPSLRRTLLSTPVALTSAAAQPMAALAAALRLPLFLPPQAVNPTQAIAVRRIRAESGGRAKALLLRAGYIATTVKAGWVAMTKGQGFDGAKLALPVRSLLSRCASAS